MPEPPTDDKHLRRLGRGGGLSMVGAAVNAVAGFALVAAVLRLYDKELAGTLFAATSFFLILTSIVLLGADTGIVRWLPAHLAVGRPADVRPTLRIAVVPVMALALLVAAGVFWFAPDIAPPMSNDDPLTADRLTAMLRVLAVALPLVAAYDLALAATRGFRTMRPTTVVDQVGRAIGQPVAVVLAKSVFGLAPIALTVAWVGPYAIGLVVAGAWLVLLLRRRVRSSPGAERSRPTRVLAREFWLFSLPRAVARISQMAMKRADIVLVLAIRGPEEAAVYTAATRFVVVGQLGVQALQQAMAPQLSALLARGDRKAALSIFQTGTTWMMLVAWPIYLICAALAPVLLQFFGEDLDSASTPVVILCLAMLFATASGPVDTVLVMAGRSALSLVNNLVGLAVMIGLDLLLIGPYGVAGAAAAWAIAIVVRNVLPLWQVRAQLHMSPFSPGTLWVGGSALLCFGIAPSLLRWLGAGYGPAVAAVAVGGLAYVAILWWRRSEMELVVLFRALTGRPSAKL